MRASSFDLDFGDVPARGPRHARRAGVRAATGMGAAATLFLTLAAFFAEPAAPPAEGRVAVARTAPAPFTKFTTKASMAEPEPASAASGNPVATFDLVAPGFEREARNVASDPAEGESGRIDRLTVGGFANAAPFVRIDIHHAPLAGAANDDFFLDMTAHARDLGLNVNRIGQPAPLATRFGAFETAEMRLSQPDVAGARERACFAARLVGPDRALEIAGVVCGGGARGPDRAALACVLDRLDYAPAGDAGAVSEFFAAARTARDARGPAGVDPCALSPDDMTASIPARPAHGRAGRRHR
jgi:hypothetical protein